MDVLKLQTEDQKTWTIWKYSCAKETWALIHILLAWQESEKIYYCLNKIFIYSIKYLKWLSKVDNPGFWRDPLTSSKILCASKMRISKMKESTSVSLNNFLILNFNRDTTSKILWTSTEIQKLFVTCVRTHINKIDFDCFSVK